MHLNNLNAPVLNVLRQTKKYKNYANVLQCYVALNCSSCSYFRTTIILCKLCKSFNTTKINKHRNVITFRNELRFAFWVLWGMTPCRRVGGSRRFEVSCHLQLPGPSVRQSDTNPRNVRTTYPATQCHIQESRNLIDTTVRT